MSEAITQKEYWDEIRALANSALDEYRDSGMETEPNEWVGDWIYETIDGHEWIIYTWRNSQVLTFSDNRDAYFEDIGPLEADGYSDAMAKMAYMAMAADLRDQIDMDDFEEAYDEEE